MTGKTSEKAKPEEKAIVQVPAADLAQEEDIFVFARNPTEMESEQGRMVEWAEGKLERRKADLRNARANLATATKRKWRTQEFKRIVLKEEKKCCFYEKIKLALKAGYHIIPDMDVDVFAIRTTRKKPKDNAIVTRWSEVPADQKSNNPPAGEGRYVASSALFEEMKIEDEPGKDPQHRKRRWATDFDDEIDFPFKLAKTVILSTTAQAMAPKIFDELGMLPRRRGADPMIVGRVTYREGHDRKSINFLIAWFIDTKEL